MRTVTYSCDRCGNQYKPENFQEGVQTFTRKIFKLSPDEKPFAFDKKMYLCPDCTKALKDWLYPTESENQVDEG